MFSHHDPGTVGDIDNDGRSELLIGAPSGGGTSPRFGSGKAHLLKGNLPRGTFRLSRTGAAAPPEEPAPYQGIALFEGLATGDQLGAVVAGIGDINGDGLPDIAIGAPGGDYNVGQSNGAIDAGEVFVFSTNVSGTILAARASLRFQSEIANARFGSAIAGGNIDGDGISDLLIGAPGAGNAGSAFVFLGRQGLTGRILTTGVASRRYKGAVNDQQLGSSVAIGDVLPPSVGGVGGEIVLGSPGINNASGMIEIYDGRATTLPQRIIEGRVEAKRFGAGALVVNGGGRGCRGDLLVSAPGIVAPAPANNLESAYLFRVDVLPTSATSTQRALIILQESVDGNQTGLAISGY